MHVANAGNLQAQYGSMCARPGASGASPSSSSAQIGAVTVPSRVGTDGAVNVPPAGTGNPQMCAPQDAGRGGRSLEMPVGKPQTLVSRQLPTTYTNDGGRG